jgi:hypothetical protein
VRANDIEKARTVDFWSHIDPKRSPLAESGVSTALGVNHDMSVIYGKLTRNKSAKADQKVAF